MIASPDEQVSLTDPDTRSMATSGRGSGTECPPGAKTLLPPMLIRTFGHLDILVRCTFKGGLS